MAIDLSSLYADVSAEELAEAKSLVGEVSSKFPTIKINRRPKADLKGNSIDVGNFIINQVATKDPTNPKKEIIEDIGIDLGATLKCTILKIGMFYGYYSNDAKERCNSATGFVRGFVYKGNNLGHRCSIKNECPRRTTQVREEKCKAQLAVYVKLESGTVAVLYIKGESYMAFSDYMKEFDQKGLPLCFVQTEIVAEEAVNGSVTYYLFAPAAIGGISKEDRQANTKLAKEVVETVLIKGNSNRTEKQERGVTQRQQAETVAPIVNDFDDEDIPF